MGPDALSSLICIAYFLQCWEASPVGNLYPSRSALSASQSGMPSLVQSAVASESLPASSVSLSLIWAASL